MEVLKVRIQSLEDAKNGEPLIDDSTPENTQKAEDFSVCILEAGTKAGNTSLMFVLKDKAGIYHYAEMTKGHFYGLEAALKGAIDKFGK
jgi:hypothetical protein